MTQALDHLFTYHCFDICQLDSVLTVTGKSRDTEAYKLLRTLHCVHYNKMRPELRERIPQLVNEALNPPVIDVLATQVALDGVEL